MRLDANQLKVALEQIFLEMARKGIKIDEDRREEIKNDIAGELHNTLTQDEIKDVNVQKKLIACITSLIMDKRKDFEFLIDSLKSDHKQDLDKGLDSKLQAELMLLTMLTNVLNPELKKSIILTASEFKQKILKDKKDKMKNPPDEKELLELNLIEKQLDSSLRNLYGGDNPRINGEINFPILGPVFGNLFAFTNQTIADPKALDLMRDSITYNSNKYDYLGLEKSNLLEDLAEGIEMSPVLSPKPTAGG